MHAAAHSSPIDDAARASYYAAAISALRFVEARSPSARRFGSEADARWGALRGNLTTADRIDLLLRDGDAQWPQAFGARAVFDLRAVAEDEAFGAEWSSLDPVEADELWRRSAQDTPAATVGAALAAAAGAWDVRLAPFDPGPIGPTDRLLGVGPGAVAAVVAAFAAGSDLDWAAQVVCVATPAPHRQLAALAAALLHAQKATVLVSSARPAGSLAGRRLLVSSDAAPADVAVAEGRSGAPA